MTGKEFRAEYDLEEPVGQGRVSSFRAVTSDGDPVMIHFLTGDDALDRPLLQRLDAAGVSSRPEVLRRLKVEERPVIVTAPLQDFRSFESWLEEPPESPEPDDVPGHGSASSKPSSSNDPRSLQPDSGTFTRLFGAEGPESEATRGKESGNVGKEEGKDANEADRPRRSASDDATGHAAEPPSPADDPPRGEFTRLFRAHDPESSGSEKDDPATREAGSASGTDEADRSDRPEPPETPNPSSPHSSGPGAPPDSSDALEAEPPTRPPEPSPGSPESKAEQERQEREELEEERSPGKTHPPSPTGPGEFTRLFGAGSATGESSPASEDIRYERNDRAGGRRSRGGSSGRASGTDGGGSGLGPGSDDYLRRLSESAPDAPDQSPGDSGTGSSPPAPPEPPPEASGPRGPSEFTRVIRGGGAGAGASGPPSTSGPSVPGRSGPGSPPASGGASKARQWLWIGAVGGIVLAAGLLVVVVLLLS